MSRKSPKRRSFREQIGFWLSIGLGLGLIPIAPGTFGSLLGPVLVGGVQFVLPPAAPLSYLFQAVIGVVFFLLGVPICEIGARVLGRKDPGAVVFDEIVAFFIVFACIPVTPKSALLGFVLFRIFDISKPWPIRRLELLPGGWGVMADDLMAGVYAFACLAVILQWILPGFS
ncbi:MAG: phosphatidylglycerophosphatase A [Planctomycetaceae bacterium]|nr:phosphatidylglycerophosphatase A [Planctomycetaceae bacterium]